MMDVVAKEQVSLEAVRCFQLAWNGMLYRLFRSGITVGILGLAVAFLSHSLIHGLVAGSSERNAWTELDARRRLAAEVSRFLRPDAQALVIASLAAGVPSRMDEYRAWSAVSPDDLARAAATASHVVQMEAEFARLSPENRAILLGELNVPQLLSRLQDATAMRRMLTRLAQTGVHPPLGSEARLRHMVQEDWPRLQEVTVAIREGHRQAVEGVAAAFPDQSAQVMLAEQPDRLFPVLAAYGFAVDALNGTDLSAFATRTLALQDVQEALSLPVIQAALVRELGVTADHLSLLRVCRWAGRSRDRADWLAAQWADTPGATPVDADMLMELAGDYVRSQRLQDVIGDAGSPGGEEAFLGLQGRLRWLMPLAFLVCVIGVANAMLMSVTERFTEIATMKCLGALDGFVMRMFVFEAAVQGVLGALGGIVLGSLLAILRAWAEYGFLMTFEADSGARIVLAAGVSMLTGILLAVLAAVGPSYLASRLAPMEAMRVE